MHSLESHFWAVAPWVLGGTVVYILVALLLFGLKTRRPKGYPPGPPTTLFLGNLLQMPTELACIRFHEMAKTYGDIMHLKVGANDFIVISSAHYAREMFEKRAAMYSDRPKNHLAQMVTKADTGEDRHLLGMSEPQIRRLQNMSRPLIGSVGLSAAFPFMEAASAELCMALLRQGAAGSYGFLANVKHWALGTPLMLIGGIRLGVDPGFDRDKYIHAQHLWLDLIDTTKAPPIDVFPVLRYVPNFLHGWYTQASIVRGVMTAGYEMILARGRARLARGLPAVEKGKWEPLSDRLLRAEGDTKAAAEIDDENKAWAAGNLLDAAVDTTQTTLSTFILAFVCHPEVQRRAQAEIDEVCEDGRAPLGTDLPKLKYLKACWLEVNRLFPAAPLGLPHLVSRDNEIDGFKIPAGASVLLNIYSLNHNAEDYPDPDRFNPDRYMDHPLGLPKGSRAMPGRRQTYTFGTGRRMCIGQEFATNEAMMAAARIVWAFDLTQAEGDVYEMDVEKRFDANVVLEARPFKVGFQPRSEEKLKAIHDEYDLAQNFLGENLGA